MSQHNIQGSEAFDRGPMVTVRKVRNGGMRRRRMRSTVAFIAGAVVALTATAIAVTLLVLPGIGGG